MTPASSKLLSPLCLTNADGTTTMLRNRLIMGSMHTGLEELPDGWERLAAFYAERAAGGVGLIVTGGLSPNSEGNMWSGMRTLDSEEAASPHRVITEAVHAQGAHIVIQLLHAGRYATHADGVAPSALRSPISPATPREMSADDIHRTLFDYAQAAILAQGVGYDGVEVMGAEGYLINQFMAPRANQRNDEWGGSLENRIRFGVEAVRKVRAATRSNFIIIFRLSMLDLVQGGCTWDEVVEMAKAIEAAGANIINPYVGWHESRVPTIATLVPRGAFTGLTMRLKSELGVPVVASNRINDPGLAEQILAQGGADLVSMARPLLADPMLLNKYASGQSALINTCIACNQGCLDEAFSGRLTTCMVNPRACRETELRIEPTAKPKRIAVVGAGPGGLACAVTAAQRGHEVTLYDAAPVIGGQFNLARLIPGKEEYSETLRYFSAELVRLGVKQRLGERAASKSLLAAGFDHLVLATGVVPRRPSWPGIEHPRVLRYADVIEGRTPVGARVAIVGAGGIGFDVAELLSHEHLEGNELEQFTATWGIDLQGQSPGGLTNPQPARMSRELWLLQRRSDSLGKGLGKTTGWIRRALLRRRGVNMLSGVVYDRFDEEGLHISVGGVARILPVDHVVICAGQDSDRSLLGELESAGQPLSLVGGARMAGELDATRAIDEGVRLACRL